MREKTLAAAVRGLTFGGLAVLLITYQKFRAAWRCWQFAATAAALPDGKICHSRFVMEEGVCTGPGLTRARGRAECVSAFIWIMLYEPSAQKIDRQYGWAQVLGPGQASAAVSPSGCGHNPCGVPVFFFPVTRSGVVP